MDPLLSPKWLSPPVSSSSVLSAPLSYGSVQAPPSSYSSVHDPCAVNLLSNSFKFDDRLETGALRAGGAPNLFSREHIGLLAQYAAIGIVYGSLWGVIYPFLNNYCHLTGVQTASTNALLSLPWTWKVFFGILSDCYPIGGYRRRPYIVIGWSLTFLTTCLMAVLPIGDPYYSDPSLAFIPINELTPE